MSIGSLLFSGNNQTFTLLHSARSEKLCLEINLFIVLLPIVRPRLSRIILGNFLPMLSFPGFAHWKIYSSFVRVIRRISAVERGGGRRF